MIFFYIYFVAQIGSEKKIFNLESICKKISKKLIERHPHIYGTRKVKTAEKSKKNWRTLNGKKEKNKGTLSNIPKTIPPMVKAMRIQRKSKKCRF